MEPNTLSRYFLVMSQHFICLIVFSCQKSIWWIVPRLIDHAIRKLEVSRENFDVLFPDVARYMIKCGKNLNIMYPNLLRVTCISHLLHNCVFKIREKCPNVDNMISKIKAAVLKNFDRKNLFKDCGSPPQPIVTRWISLLSTARNKSNCGQFSGQWNFSERIQRSGE